jgi:CRISPR-associated endonuclease/helicase Cas3
MSGKATNIITETLTTKTKHVIAKSDGEWLDVHTIKDLNTCYRLVDNLPFSEEDKKLIKHYLELGIMCHDVGKAATGFQNSLPLDGVVKPRWGHRHELLSAAFAVALGLPPLAVFIVLTHHKDLHGEPFGCLKYEDLPLFPDEIPYSWEVIVKEFNDNIEALRNDWIGICEFVNRKDLIPFEPLTPLSILGDTNWLIRNKQREKIPFADRYFASLLRGLLISSDHIASSGIGFPAKIPILKRYDIGNKKHVKHNFQKKSSAHKGNLMLRAPTGSGKTDAGLGWSQLNQKYNGRLFYVLPTQASINAMYQTIRGKEILVSRT